MNTDAGLFRRLRGSVCTLACSVPLIVGALPMGSADTWMVMGERSAEDVELALNYATTGRDAWGLMAKRWDEMPHPGAPRSHGLRREFAGLTYTRLLRRWNLPHAQSNLWLVGMAGAARAAERSGSESSGSLALLADYETTRVYTGAGLERMRSGSWRHDTAYARAGFSFFEVEYEETQPWLVLEVKRERFTASTKDTVTPLLRLIHRRYFVELGRNRDGAVVNFMFNY
jgi:hypothetical protein